MKEWSLILSALQPESLCILNPKKLGKLSFSPKRPTIFKIWQIKLLLLIMNILRLDVLGVKLSLVSIRPITTTTTTDFKPKQSY